MPALSGAICAGLIAAWSSTYEGFGNTRSRTLLAKSGSLVAVSVGASPTLINSRHRTAADSGTGNPTGTTTARPSAHPADHRATAVVVNGPTGISQHAEKGICEVGGLLVGWHKVKLDGGWTSAQCGDQAPSRRGRQPAWCQDPIAKEPRERRSDGCEDGEHGHRLVRSR